MMKVCSRSWSLIKAPLDVLSAEEGLLAYPLLMFLIVASTLGLAAVSVEAGYQTLLIPTLVVGVTLFVLLAVTSGTLNAIYRSAVCLYAEKGEVAPPLDRSMIHQAFGPKR
jgi:hypothetical protein